jgi:hypothetical protein
VGRPRQEAHVARSCPLPTISLLIAVHLRTISPR